MRNTVFIYDPEGDAWTTGPPLSRDVIDGRAATHDGEPHLIWEAAGLVRRNGAWVRLGGSPPTAFPVLESVRLG